MLTFLIIMGLVVWLPIALNNANKAQGNNGQGQAKQSDYSSNSNVSPYYQPQQPYYQQPPPHSQQQMYSQGPYYPQQAPVPVVPVDQQRVDTYFANNSVELKNAILNFERTAGLHDSNNMVPEFSLRAEMSKCYQMLVDLFEIAENEPDAIKFSLEVEYADKLRKISRLLGSRYYARIVKNPTYWSNPIDRLNDVKKILAVFEDQIITNIRQLNDRSNIDFNVDMNVFLAQPEYDFEFVEEESDYKRKNFQ